MEKLYTTNDYSSDAGDTQSVHEEENTKVDDILALILSAIPGLLLIF